MSSIYYEQLAKMGNYLATLGYVEGREGNLSARTHEGIIVKSTNVFMQHATPADYSLISMDGKLIRGNEPSSEYRMHLEIYRRSKDVNFIVHTHPINTLVYADFTDRIVTTLTESKLYFSSYVPVLPVIEPGTQDLANAVASSIAEGHEGIVLRKHGLVTVGVTLDVAVMRTIAIEKESRIEILKRTMIR
ncbi:MAG: class II aldolase/adducin family protein [Nitrososphaeria archaeon]